MCICTQSTLITFKKIYQSEILFLLHLQVSMTYFLNFFLMNLKVNDLIVNEEEKKKDRKMNDSLFI